MKRYLGSALALLFLIPTPARPERRLVRPPGVTQYAPLTARLQALAAPNTAHPTDLTSLGKTWQGRDIWMVTVHGGPKTILYLCRQHGHEPASTEGALRFLDGLAQTPPDGPLSRATVCVVPMANPDGSEAYLRHNAHDKDLNRDWKRQSQPETQALLGAIRTVHPDLIVDQHELYPDDDREDFTETAGGRSGAPHSLILDVNALQERVAQMMAADGFPTALHRYHDRHPARLAHRYGCVVLGIPTILFETNRVPNRGRDVAARARVHEAFMNAVLRAVTGEAPSGAAPAEQPPTEEKGNE